MPATPLTAVEFEELRGHTPDHLPFAQLPDIPWGRMSDQQFETFSRRAGTNIGRAAELRASQRQADVYPTRQGNGTWVRAAEWDNLKRVTMQSAFGHTFDDFMPEHWFQYFWREIDGQDDAIGAAEKLKFVKAAQPFFVWHGAGQPARLRDSLGGLIRNAPAAQVREFLQAAMECGCKRIPIAAHAHEEAADVYGRWLTDAGTVANRTRMAWRCESRGYEDVLRADGLQRQVQAAVRRRALHFDQPWHPFSDPANLECLWYRRAHTDNELYAVLSVAKTFGDALVFPLIEDHFVHASGNQPDLNLWPPHLLADNKHLIYDVDFSDGTTQRKIVQQVNVFLGLVRGNFIDTGAIQGAGAYPEWGVFDIDLARLWGAVPVTKVYHGLDDLSGFTALIDTARARAQIRSLADRHASFGPGWFQSLAMEFDRAIRKGPRLGLCWTATGSREHDELRGARGGHIIGVRKVGQVSMLTAAFERGAVPLRGR